jgi:adenosylcobinamide kinase/adenosylcobinamide-phosphate guanylyltransferase
LKSTLILGGARSGKSRLSVEMAKKRGGDVLFVATAEPKDEELIQRVAAHRKNRPADWKVLEAPLHTGSRITQDIGSIRTVIIDCITLLVSNVFEQHPGVTDVEIMEKAVVDEIDELTECIRKSKAYFIIVSNEVGLGIIPGDQTTRLYRDLLGRANHLLAERADEVLLLVAGMQVTLKKP